MRYLLPAFALLGALGCTGPAQAPGPYLLEVARAAPAVSTPGQQIDTIAVRVVDARGDLIPGVTVTWHGDGVIEPLSPRTDASGVARARWILPRWEGSQWPDNHGGPSGEFSVSASAPGVEAIAVRTTARAFRVDQVDRSGCGIRDGELWCWSRWEVDPPWHPQLVEIPVPHPLREFRSSVEMRCVLDRDRVPWCAQDGSGYKRLNGVPALQAIGSPNIGYFDSMFCGLAVSDGRPWCWDEKGPGTAVARVPHDGPLTSLSVGGSHACGLMSDGRAVCWGLNGFGQLGNGTTTARAGAVIVAGGPAFSQVAVGGNMSCGMSVANDVWCWGRGIDVIGPVPTRITAPSAKGQGRMVIGDDGDSYLIAGGQVRTWWRNEDLHLEPPFGGQVAVADLSTDYWACLQSTTGEVYCSYSMFREVSSGSRILPDELIPVPDPASRP